MSALVKRGRPARNAQYALNANGWPRHPCCHHGTSTCDVDARDGGTEIPRHGSASVHSGDDEVCTRSRSSNFRASAEEKEGALAEVCRMRISNKWMARGLIVSINHIWLLCLSTTFGYLSHWGPVSVLEYGFNKCVSRMCRKGYTAQEKRRGKGMRLRVGRREHNLSSTTCPLQVRQQQKQHQGDSDGCAARGACVMRWCEQVPVARLIAGLWREKKCERRLIVRRWARMQRWRNF